MNKKNDKIDKKSDLKTTDKTVVKKTSSFKKKRRLKKISHQVLPTYIQLLITLLFRLLMKTVMLFPGLLLEQKVLRVQENQLHMQLR